MMLSEAIEEHLGRKVDFLSEIVLNDDGDGQYIAEWNAPETQPTKEVLDALIPTVEDNERKAKITAEATRRIEEKYPPLLQHKEFSKTHKIILNMVLILDPDIISKLTPEDQATLTNTLAIDDDISATRGKENAAHADGTPAEDVIWQM